MKVQLRIREQSFSYYLHQWALSFAPNPSTEGWLHTCDQYTVVTAALQGTYQQQRCRRRHPAPCLQALQHQEEEEEEEGGEEEEEEEEEEERRWTPRHSWSSPTTALLAPAAPNAVITNRAPTTALHVLAAQLAVLAVVELKPNALGVHASLSPPPHSKRHWPAAPK
jgi:hypothetical protein